MAHDGTIPDDLVVPIARLMATFGLSVWVYRGADNGRHVARESWTGVSDGHDAVSNAAVARWPAGTIEQALP